MIPCDDDSLDVDLLEAIAERLDSELPPASERRAPIPLGALPRPRRTVADTPAHGLAMVASAATTVPR